MNSENINDNELLEMKQQMQELKRELERATTLREDGLKRALTRGSNRFRNRELQACFFVGFATLAIPVGMYFNHFSILICAFTFVFFLFALCWEIHYYRKLHVADVMAQPLVKAYSDLLEYKRINKIWLFRIGIPFIIVWFTWYVYEFLQNNPAPEDKQLAFVIGIITALCIGGLIGGLIGYYSFYRPQMKLADRMMEQIKDLQAE